MARCTSNVLRAIAVFGVLNCTLGCISVNVKHKSLSVSDCGEFEWKVQAHPREGLRPGEKVYLRLDPEHTLAVRP